MFVWGTELVFGIRAVESSLAGSSSLCVPQLEMCAGPGVRCAEVGFFQVSCPVWPPDAGRECRCTHPIVITLKNSQIHFCWDGRDCGSWCSEVTQVVLPINFTFPLLNTDS